MRVISFLRNNKYTVLGMVIGTVAAYFYWNNIGIFWGTYPLSSECWVNCIYGALFGALIGCLFSETRSYAPSNR